MQTLTASYNRHGYVIEDNLDGEELYRAGNCKYESTTEVNPKSDAACDLRTIRSMALSTLKEECRDLGAVNGGIYRIDDPE